MLLERSIRYVNLGGISHSLPAGLSTNIGAVTQLLSASEWRPNVKLTLQLLSGSLGVDTAGQDYVSFENASLILSDLAGGAWGKISLLFGGITALLQDGSMYSLPIPVEFSQLQAVATSLGQGLAGTFLIAVNNQDTVAHTLTVDQLILRMLYELYDNEQYT